MSIIPQETLFPQDVAYKQCNRCKQSLPATSEYYTRDRSKKDGWHTLCRVCKKTPKEVLPPVPDGYKRCRTCQEIKLASTEFFNAIPLYKSPDGLNAQCKECRNTYRRELRKGEPKIIQPKAATKTCPTCQREWPATLEYFSYDRGTRDRLNRQCKECANKENKHYRARPGGKEARRAYRRTRAAIDTLYHKTYRAIHADHERKRAKQYRETHKEQTRAYRRVYYRQEKVKQRRRTSYLNYQARKRAIPGSHTPQQIRQQYDRQKGRCYYCQKKVKWGQHHVEHTYPLSRVIGMDIPANDISYLVISCGPCNVSKGARFPWEWIDGGRLL